MRFWLQFVWSLNDLKSNKRRMEGEIIFNKIRDNLKSKCWSIQMLKLQTLFKCFLVCFAMLQVMLNLSLLFIEFLGSCSHWRVTNGVMPCVLGSTDFYLKIWVNILTITMLLCSSGYEHQNVDVHHDIHLGSSFMSVWWVSGFIQCMPHDFLGIIHMLCLLHKHQKVVG